MSEPRFLQIHTLSPYTAALLNRDDSGLAKRLPFGGRLRTRISSQCLKRHWRKAKDPHALDRIIPEPPDGYRSRDLVTKRIVDPVRKQFQDDVVAALEQWFQFAVYSGNKRDEPKERGKSSKAEKKKNRQTLLFGTPEINWLSSEFERLAAEADGDPDGAFELGREWVGPGGKGFQSNIDAIRKGATLHAGLTSALFGRMVTSDPDANITAPVHVAHAFTVHAEEAESDYFTAVDDLSVNEPGADTIQETELTSGLYYGCVVVDLPGLVENLGGDASLAGQLLHNLIYLIAEVSPGAKLGSTAPYGRASFMLLEAGDRQPRSLAEAYRTPCAPHLDPAISALSSYLGSLDEAYGTGEERRVMSLVDAKVPGAGRGSLADLSGWAKGLPKALQA